MLLGALACSFAGQARIAETLGRNEVSHRSDLSSGVAGALAPWLTIAGLAMAAIAVMMA